MKSRTHAALVLAAGLTALALPIAGGQSPEAVDQIFPAPPPPPTFQAIPAGDPQAAARAAQLEKRLEAIEARLGPTSRPASVTYNLERRLADLEKRIQQLEQQVARWQQVDQRVRRLEMK